MKCISVTKRGKPCKNYAINTMTMCKSHNPKKKTFNEECPICLCSEGKMHIANCKHQLHSSCAKDMLSLKCPLCQQLIQNYPPSIKNKIIKNEQKSIKEMEVVSLPPHLTLSNLEVINAINFLSEIGIPQVLYPIVINVDLENAPPEGLIFSSVIGGVMEYIENLMENSDENNDDSFEDFDARIEINFLDGNLVR